MKYQQWQTRRTDLECAQGIIDKYIDMNNGEPLMLEIDMDTGAISSPEWFEEIRDFFTEKYGKERGNEVVTHVLTYCVVGNETVH